MRQLTVFVLLFGLMTTSVLPAFGQKAVCYRRAKDGSLVRVVSRDSRQAASKPSRKQAPAARNVPKEADNYADFEKVEASAAPEGGAKIQWKMNSETGNVGFRVYRVTDQGRELVDDRIILGSAAKSMNVPIYGETYSVVDPAGTPSSKYVVEALGPSGQQVESKRIKAVAAESSAFEVGARSSDPDPNAGLIISTGPKMKVASAELTSDPVTQKWVAAQSGAKIAVKKEGFYRVRIGELETAVPGLFTNANTANWRLFRDGVEQSAIVGVDPIGAYIEFYGRGIDTPESDTHIYYLLVDPSQAGRRIARTRGGRMNSAPVATSYVATTALKERTQYISSILNDRENWWGSVVTSSGNNVPGGGIPAFTLSGVDTANPNAKLTIKMQDWIQGSYPSTTQVMLNSVVIGTLSASTYRAEYSAQLSIPPNVLRDGSNTLKLTSTNGGYQLFDSCSLEYSRSYQADRNSLAFTAPISNAVKVTGFASPNIRLFMVGVDDSLTQVSRLALESSGTTYSLNLPSTAHPNNTKFFAIESSAILSAAGVTPNKPSNLSNTAPAADMIIISHSAPDFMAAANAWKNYRVTRDPSLNVIVTDVADVMDEFNYGSYSSKAINDFLQYERVPAKKQYVLMLGDASYDPRNYTGLAAGSWNLVPIKMVNTLEMETGSDDALADFDEDGLPEMAVGRIPARTPAYITDIFAKTQTFEANPALRDPRRGVLFAHDRYKYWDFRQTSDNLAAELDQSVPRIFVSHGYVPPQPPDVNGVEPADPNSRARLIETMNSQDAYLVSYVGHGAQSMWADGGNFLHSNVVDQIRNPGLSIYTMLTCLNGYFLNPGTATRNEDSLAELLMKNPNGGGPAAWASDGATTADVQEQMGLRFMRHVNAGDIPRMGDLIRDAKSVLPAGADVRYSWIYFGDPMLQVR